MFISTSLISRCQENTPVCERNENRFMDPPVTNLLFTKIQIEEAFDNLTKGFVTIVKHNSDHHSL